MSLLIIIFILVNINYIYGFSQSNQQNQLNKCENCKWFWPDINGKMSRCKIFTINSDTNDFNKISYNLASHCRDNDFLCGKNGWFFTDKNSNSNSNSNSELEYINLMEDNQIEQIESNTKKLLNDNSSFSSISKKPNHKINDNFDINNSNKEEKVFYNNYVKNIAKSNTAKVYKKEKDIYKLFRKK